MGLIDSVIYIIALFLIFKNIGIDLDAILSTTSSTNNTLQMIMLCIVFGISTAVNGKSAYDETDDIKPYLLISSLKTYVVNLTFVLAIYIYLLQSLENVFEGIRF